MDFRNLFTQIKSNIQAKRYVGLVAGTLPVGPKNWGKEQFLDAVEISLYTNRAIAKRADKVGEIEFQLKDAKDKIIERDPLLDLLYRPNPVFTGRQFWALAQKYYDLVGEVYILVEGEREVFEKQKKIKGLHLLIPTLVTPFFDGTGRPTKYEYRTAEKTIEYQPEQIIYMHNPNPKEPLRGQSLLRAGISSILTESQINTYHSRILENGGKVEGVFKFKTDRLTEDQLAKLKDDYQKEYGAAKKAGMPLFLGGDADYIKTGLSPDELAFLGAKKMIFEDICILTGVPKSMLASTTDVKFDNADADRAIFLRETIHPLLVNLTTTLDEKLFPDDRTLTFVDPTPENVEQKRKNIETANAIYALTTNEKREMLEDIGITVDPVKDGDEILVPFNLMPQTGQPAGNEKRIKSQNKEIDHPLRSAEMRDKYYAMQIKRQDRDESLFVKKLNSYFNGQRDRLIEALPEQKAVMTKQSVEELLKLELEVKIGNELFLPLLTELLKEAGINTMEFVGSNYQFNLTDDIVSWLASRSDIFLTSINETTFETLRGVFADSLANGDTRDELIDRIQETYGDIKRSRATTIARTEVHNANQYGILQGYKQAGVTIKIWVAVRDSATRDSHASIDGEERPIDRPFSNGLMLPGDPSGPAEEVINCRCQI